MSDNDIVASTILINWLRNQKQEKMAVFVEKIIVGWSESSAYAKGLLDEREYR